MSGHNPYKAYSRATHTVAKTRQVVMLYDGAIRFVQQAKIGMESKDINERYEKLVKAGDIITGLQSCLDFENGRETAQTLHDFYEAIGIRILMLHRSTVPAEWDAVVRDLKKMRDTWNSIDQGSNSVASPSEPLPIAAQHNPMDAVTVTAESLTISV
jgi:flagellar protein FliS